MWKMLVALLVGVAPVVAQENLTAYDALRVVGDHLGRNAVNHIISVSGTEGTPQPETWHVVLESPDGRGAREIEISHGEFVSDQPSRGIVGSAEGATINTRLPV